MQLNEQQQIVVNSVLGSYLITAPVGTGKTTVLTERIIKALDSGINPEEILALTFTNRAAEEMSKKIRQRLNNKNIFDALTIKTFHGFCAYFVKAEAKQLGIPADFTIFDETEQSELMKNILRDYPEIHLEEANQNRQIADLQERLYQCRLGQLESEIGIKREVLSISDTLKEINQKYLSALSDRHALDFNELVLQTLRGLYFDEQLKSKWSKRYRFIQLDEFQDTHLSEYLVVKQLAREHKNLTLIGDLDQTIYSWRGSDPVLVVKTFKQHFAPVTELHLEMNYRSQPEVIEVFKSFLMSMQNRVTKNISTPSILNKSAKCVDLFTGHNFSEEADYLITQIKKIQQQEPGARMAVLTRANNLINRLAEIFSQKNVAHVTVDKYDFFRRQEIRDLFAYLKILFNRFDAESAYRLLQRPARHIGEATLNDIRDRGRHCGLQLTDFLYFPNFQYAEPFANLLKIWEGGRIVVLDTETTGTNPIRDEIIQIYAREVINGQSGAELAYYLKTKLPVGVSQSVHGISDEFLAQYGQDAKKILAELKKFIGSSAVSGHNVNFDLQMLLENGKRHGVMFDFKESYDTLDLAKRLVVSENYKLGTLVKLFGLSEATHDAKDDVMATVGLLTVMVEKLTVGTVERQKMIAEFSKKFLKLSGQIQNWRDKAKVLRPAEVLDFIWQDSGLGEYYMKEKDGTKRQHSVDLLIKMFTDDDEADKLPEVALQEFIKYAALAKDLNFLGIEQGKVPIVTVHQVKGLEFDYVFIAGVNEGKFPLRRSDQEEEKRLFYVAMTRAKKHIFITSSQFDEYGRSMARSHFVDLIDSALVREN